MQFCRQNLGFSRHICPRNPKFSRQFCPRNPEFLQRNSEFPCKIDGKAPLADVCSVYRLPRFARSVSALGLALEPSRSVGLTMCAIAKENRISPSQPPPNRQIHRLIIHTFILKASVMGAVAWVASESRKKSKSKIAALDHWNSLGSHAKRTRKLKVFSSFLPEKLTVYLAVLHEKPRVSRAIWSKKPGVFLRKTPSFQRKSADETPSFPQRNPILRVHGNKWSLIIKKVHFIADLFSRYKRSE